MKSQNDYELCKKWSDLYRPYALTSRLHYNDAMLVVKTCRAARTCCAGRALRFQPLSQCAGPGRPGGMACRGWPAGCMLGDGARGSASFDPQHAGAPFCDVICIRSIKGVKVGACFLVYDCSMFVACSFVLTESVSLGKLYSNGGTTQNGEDIARYVISCEHYPIVLFFFIPCHLSGPQREIM